MQYRLLPILLATTVISACGGSDDSEADMAAAYAGTWTSTCHADGDSVYRYREAVALERTGGSTLRYQGTLATYTDAACAGAAEDVAEYAGTIVLAGSKNVDAAPVDKANITPADQDAMKNLLQVRGGDLFVGKKDAAVDAEGYPAAVESGYKLVRGS